MPQTAVKLDESFDSNSLTMKENTSQNHSLDLVFHSIHSHSSIKSLLASNLISWQWSDMICRFVLQTRAKPHIQMDATSWNQSNGLTIYYSLDE